MIVVRHDYIFNSFLCIEVHTDERVAVLIHSDRKPNIFDATEWLTPHEGNLLIEKFPSAVLSDESRRVDENSVTSMTVSDADLIVITLMVEPAS